MLGPSTRSRLAVLELPAARADRRRRPLRDPVPGRAHDGFRGWRREARSIVLLGLPGTAATAALLALVGRYVLGLDWELAALVGIALSPTDPAAVYATLRGGGAAVRPRTILEGESGFNDPVGISLMVVAVSLLASDEASIGDGATRLLEELGIGLAGGLLGAGVLLALLRATPRLEDGVQSVALMGGALVVGSATASLHGSGFLAVYVAGRPSRIAGRARTGADMRSPSPPPRSPSRSSSASSELRSRRSSPAQTSSTESSSRSPPSSTVRPIVASACLLDSRLARAERRARLDRRAEGAVPLLLAAYPALDALPEASRTAAIVLVATALSILSQGALFTLLSRRTPAAQTTPARPP